MKTLKLLLIVVGVFLISSAYSYTLLNLMVDEVSINPLDNPIVLNDAPQDKTIKTLNEKDGEAKSVELEEIVISSGKISSSSNCIRQQIGYPAWAANSKLEGLVMVAIVFNENGNVEIRAVNSSNQELGNYVAHKLKQVHFNNCTVEANKEYCLKFIFQIL